MIEDDLDEFLDSLNDCDDMVQHPQKPNQTLLQDNIDDILNDTDLTFDFSSGSGSTSNNKPSSLTINTKCSTVYLGKPTHQKSCTHVRCSDCDCAVVCFHDFAWVGDVEYLFLRNHYPDFERLKERLRSELDSRAYACQCNSVTVKTHTSLNSLKSSLKWFCSPHK